MLRKIIGCVFLIAAFAAIVAWIVLLGFMKAYVWPWPLLAVIEPIIPTILLFAGTAFMGEKKLGELWMPAAVFYGVAVGLGLGLIYYFKG